MKMSNLKLIVNPLLKWYNKEKRDLPWRKTSDAYKIWISEIMLQQTRVEAVKEYYKHFLESLPTIQDLAKVEEDKLLKLWQGLGYYNRARNLKKCAEVLVNEFDSKFPEDYEQLKKLPGIGPYAAASIGSIALNLQTPAIDGNVLRVMTRIYEDDRDISSAKVRKDYFEKLKVIMPEETRNFTESLMELGALICLPNGNPLCESCPIAFLCNGYHHQTMMNYPKKKKEIKRNVELKTIMILKYKNKYALQKRNNKGLLASLYEFYNIENNLNLEELQSNLKMEGIEYSEIIELGTEKHIFSHLEWHMYGYMINCLNKPSKDFLWVAKKEIEEKYSLPNAYIKFMNKL